MKSSTEIEFIGSHAYMLRHPHRLIITFFLTDKTEKLVLLYKMLHALLSNVDQNQFGWRAIEKGIEIFFSQPNEVLSIWFNLP